MDKRTIIVKDMQKRKLQSNHNNIEIRETYSVTLSRGKWMRGHERGPGKRLGQPHILDKARIAGITQ